MTRRRLWSEVLIVLGLSFGASAVWSVIKILELTTQQKALSEQTATLNASLNRREVFDLAYNLYYIVTGLMPVLLVAFLLWQTARPHLSKLGIDFRHPGKDVLWGVVLALTIGIPGIGLYLLSRTVGINVDVVASALPNYWWAIPVLLLRALLAGVSEEVIVIGYLYSRLRTLGFGPWTIILSTAVLRGTYHLYQGFGAFLGNFAMGVLFGWLYTRYQRLLPFVIAHVLLDAAVFVGYPWAAATFPWL